MTDLRPRSIADSPWFWAYLFGTAALIALALIGPKYQSRQAQIERQYQGRQRAAEIEGGREPTVELSSDERTIISLGPLFLGLAAITSAAWFLVWRARTAAREQSTPGPGLRLGRQRSSCRCHGAHRCFRC